MSNEVNAGFVYVLKMSGHPYYKIGRTQCLDRRLCQISPSSPRRLELCFAHWTEQSAAVETSLHKYFRKHRLNGEWFLLGPESLAVIRALLLRNQADMLMRQIIDRFRSYDNNDGGIVRIEQYGRLIALSSKRALRRHEHLLYLDFRYSQSQQSQNIVDPILESEVVI